MPMSMPVPVLMPAPAPMPMPTQIPEGQRLATHRLTAPTRPLNPSTRRAQQDPIEGLRLRLRLSYLAFPCSSVVVVTLVFAFEDAFAVPDAVALQLQLQLHLQLQLQLRLSIAWDCTRSGACWLEFVFHFNTLFIEIGSVPRSFVCFAASTLASRGVVCARTHANAEEQFNLIRHKYAAHFSITIRTPKREKTLACFAGQ